MTYDGIGFNDKHSFTDFGLTISSRNVGIPSRKNIRASVPYQNGFYDFSGLNGAAAWESREIEFIFDVIGDTPQDVERDVAEAIDWLGNAQDTDISDDTLTDYHWHGSIDGLSLEYDESGCQCSITAVFVCQPFKIADTETRINLTVGTHTVLNDGMACTIYATSASAATVQIGTVSQTISANTKTKLNMELQRGKNTIVIGSATVILSFNEVVL